MWMLPSKLPAKIRPLLAVSHPRYGIVGMKYFQVTFPVDVFIAYIVVFACCQSGVRSFTPQTSAPSVETGATCPKVQKLYVAT